jgi:DNA-binding response OmpR family regulator
MLRRAIASFLPRSGERESAGARRRVLLVDDDPHLRELLKIAFEASGYEVAVAGNGDDALKSARERQPDAIVLDANMPVLDGFSTLRKLRAGWRTRRIPVLMLTTRSHHGDMVAGYRGGAQAYLTKPFITEEVLHCVAELLQSNES